MKIVSSILIFGFLPPHSQRLARLEFTNGIRYSLLFTHNQLYIWWIGLFRIQDIFSTLVACKPRVTRQLNPLIARTCILNGNYCPVFNSAERYVTLWLH